MCQKNKDSVKKEALIIGNSDGIGLAITSELLKQGWKAFGLSRSSSSIENVFYKHYLTEVQNDEYVETLKTVLAKFGTPDLCIYCPGIGELLDVTNMSDESKIFEVNLLGMVKTVSHVLPEMVRRGSGHFIGISSVADEMLSSEAPSYHASKAGLSSYLESLALAMNPKGIHVTNVRFGFVDTKMAKGDVKPFMIKVDEAARHLMRCIEKKPVRYTAPRIVIPLVKFRKWMQAFGVK